MDTKICASCVGLEKCNKYCQLQAGINLVNFIKGIDIVDTKIGELREDHKTKKLAYIVSGHMVEAVGAPTYMLSDLDVAIDASGRFTSYAGMTPQQLLRAYLDSMGVSEEIKESSIKTFKEFNGNKKLPIPIKAGAECEITVKENNKTITLDCKTLSIKWDSDKKNGKLTCYVLCEIEKHTLENNTRIVKIPVSEYGESIRLPQIERTLKSSETDREMIKMTSVGYIKPIVISDDKFVLALDGQHLYRIVDDKIFIIGNWKNGKIADFNNGTDSVIKSKAYKKLHNAASYIDRHRRFIAPYGMMEVNKIEL